MIPIVKVEPAEPCVSLTWMLSSRCNYDCMYCPTEWHDLTSALPNLETLQQAWKNFYSKTQNIGLPYKISFTGGEVTVNRNFLPFAKWLRENYNVDKILITTNGSASVGYYLKLSKIVDSISFSVHSEFFNEQEFFDKVYAVDKVMLRPEKSVHVNIMNEYWNHARIEVYKQWLDSRQISYSVNEVDYSRRIRLDPNQQGVYNLVT